MIRVEKQSAPLILIDNASTWTQELLDLIAKHGGYDKIPKSLKDSAVNKYRHPDIQAAVGEMTKGKCVFCESIINETTYLNIEHFKPKSKFPDLTFDWNNLFPSCLMCNNGKDKDVDGHPADLVNPLTEDPEQYFTYKELKICARDTAPNSQKANDTIINCKLQRNSLIIDRAKILTQFYDYEDRLETAVKSFAELKRKDAKITRALNIIESLKVLKSNTGKFEQYAGFWRETIRKSRTVNDAMNILASLHADLGLPKTGFDWGWNYFTVN